MPTRSTYWSCTKFATWISTTFGGVSKPRAASMEDWESWRTKSKNEHPFVYWIVEEFLDNLQDFIYWPYDKYDDFRCYMRNRFVTKTHYAPTKLKPGQWHETDTRMLHGMFELLVDFIEVEKSHMQFMCNEFKEKQPWWHKFKITRWPQFRSRELGLEHLKWEMDLVFDDTWVSKDDPHYGQPTGQAVGAKEQLELYTWWKDVRPYRPDPYDISGWSDHCDRLKIDHNTEALFINEKTEEEQTRGDAAHKKLAEIEESYEREDEEMLIRLIKIRKDLWT